MWSLPHLLEPLVQQVDVTADVALEHEGRLLLLTLLPTGVALHPGRAHPRRRGRRKGRRKGWRKRRRKEMEGGRHCLL